MDCSNVFSNSSFFKIFSTEQGCAWSEKRIGDEGNSFCFSTKSEADFAALISGDNKDWDRRHFAKYEDGKIYTWIDGCTSFTTNKTTSWKYAKLYKEEEE